MRPAPGLPFCGNVNRFINATKWNFVCYCYVKGDSIWQSTKAPNKIGGEMAHYSMGSNSVPLPGTHFKFWAPKGHTQEEH